MASLLPQNAWRGPKRHDPWWKAEQWRYEHPVVATKYLWRSALPGFGWASVAFLAYCGVEYWMSSTAASGDAHHKNHRVSNEGTSATVTTSTTTTTNHA